MTIALAILALALIIGGLAGTVVPALPGIPMLFGGIWLAAVLDDYHHLPVAWLVVIALVGLVGVACDFIAGSLGAKRIGATPEALWGAGIGTVAGLFFGLPGLILGPFLGALLGEFSTGRSVLRSAHVGLGTWLGLLLGAIAKLVLSLIMLALALAGWLWNRSG